MKWLINIFFYLRKSRYLNLFFIKAEQIYLFKVNKGTPSVTVVLKALRQSGVCTMRVWACLFNILKLERSEKRTQRTGQLSNGLGLKASAGIATQGRPFPSGVLCVKREMKLRAGMKLALLCLCIVQLAFGSRRTNDREAAAREDVPRRKASRGTGECVG